VVQLLGEVTHRPDLAVELIHLELIGVVEAVILTGLVVEQLKF